MPRVSPHLYCATFDGIVQKGSAPNLEAKVNEEILGPLPGLAAQYEETWQFVLRNERDFNAVAKEQIRLQLEQRLLAAAFEAFSILRTAWPYNYIGLQQADEKVTFVQVNLRK